MDLIKYARKHRHRPAWTHGTAHAMLPFLKKRARERQGTRTDLQPPSNNCQKLDAFGRATEQAARAVKTNRQYVADFQAIKKHDPNIAKKVRDGAVTLSKAKRQMKREKDRERAAMIKPLNKATSKAG